MLMEYNEILFLRNGELFELINLKRKNIFQIDVKNYKIAFRIVKKKISLRHENIFFKCENPPLCVQNCEVLEKKKERERKNNNKIGLKKK